MFDVDDEYKFVFTSMRYDDAIKKDSRNPTCPQCPESKAVYLIKYHYDRLVKSAHNQGWFDIEKKYKDPTALFQRCQNAVMAHQRKTGNKCPFKVRVLVKHDYSLTFDIAPIFQTRPPLLFPTTLDHRTSTHPGGSTHKIFKVVLDALPTVPQLATRDKTHYRCMYDYARQAAGIQSYQDAKEVLLFNLDHEIMDASITTPYFYRPQLCPKNSSGWITPENRCGGQTGTTRRWALDQGLCSMGVVKVDSLRHGEVVWLSNAVKGFWTARYVECGGRCKGPGFFRCESEADGVPNLARLSLANAGEREWSEDDRNDSGQPSEDGRSEEEKREMREWQEKRKAEAELKEREELERREREEREADERRERERRPREALLKL